MTKIEAVAQFKDYVFSELARCEIDNGTTDRPARREAWNNFTDMLCKDGTITENQYNNWGHPRGLETWNAKLYI